MLELMGQPNVLLYGQIRRKRGTAFQEEIISKLEAPSGNAAAGCQSRGVLLTSEQFFPPLGLDTRTNPSEKEMVIGFPGAHADEVSPNGCFDRQTQAHPLNWLSTTVELNHFFFHKLKK